jgi:hypothetical protein
MVIFHERNLLALDFLASQGGALWKVKINES